MGTNIRSVVADGTSHSSGTASTMTGSVSRGHLTGSASRSFVQSRTQDDLAKMLSYTPPDVAEPVTGATGLGCLAVLVFLAVFYPIFWLWGGEDGSGANKLIGAFALLVTILAVQAMRASPAYKVESARNERAYERALRKHEKLVAQRDRQISTYERSRFCAACFLLYDPVTCVTGSPEDVGEFVGRAADSDRIFRVSADDHTMELDCKSEDRGDVDGNPVG